MGEVTNISWTAHGWEEYLWWQKNDPKTLKRVNALIKDILRGGHQGLGKPKPLKHGLSQYWARRITDEHRLVYKLEAEEVLIVSCRYHYF